MQTLNKHTLIYKVLISICLLYSGSVIAESGKSLNFSVSSRFDDNVFRSDAKDQANEGKGKSDFVTITNVNGAYARSFSKQTLSLNVNLSDQRYSERQNLNSNPVSINVGWGFNVSSKLSSSLDSSYSHQSSEFEDTLIKDKNTITRTGLGYKINYQPHLKTNLGVGFQFSEIENSLSVLENRNRINKTLSVNGSYQLTNAIVSTINFNHLESAPSVESSEELEYEQSSSSIGIVWGLSNKTKLNASLGRSSARSQDSLNYNLNINYQLSAKSSINLDAYQSVSESTSDISLLTESQGLSFGFGWQISPKLMSNINFKRVDQTSDSLFLNGSNNEINDLVTSYQLGLAYLFNRNFTINASLSHNARQSELELSDYVANIYQITFNLKI